VLKNKVTLEVVGHSSPTVDRTQREVGVREKACRLCGGAGEEIDQTCYSVAVRYSYETLDAQDNPCLNA